MWARIPHRQGQFKGDTLGHARICRTELENVAVFIAAADRAQCPVHALLISSAVLSSLLSLPAQYAEQGLCNGTVSVRLSIPAWANCRKPAAAGLLLCARRAGDVDRLLQQQRAAGQCHVVSVRRYS